MFVGGTSLVADTGLPLMARLSSLAFSAALVAGLFTAIAWLNARAVKQIDAQIAELEQ